jgi:hypothetical protein
MQTQVAVKPDAFQGVIAEMTPERIYIAAEDKRERYFFYPGDEPNMKNPGGLSVNSPCIPYRRIYRCQITPCISRQIPARTEEIAEGARIAGTVGFRFGFSKYWLASGPEADELVTNYGNVADSARNWGLVELLPEKLTGMTYAEYAKFHINEAIFPDWPNIPDVNQGILDHLYEMNALIENNDHSWFKWSLNNSESILHRDVYLGCIPQMIMATESAQQHQVEVVRNSNIAVTLPSTEPGYKRNFDDRDRLYSKRTGVPLAINALRQNTSDALELAVERMAAKLQPAVAPQLDPSVFGMVATAVVQALRSEGLVSVPAEDAGQKAPKQETSKQKTNAERS